MPERVKLENGAFLPKETVQELAAKYCRRRLIDELRVVDPAVIIPLGKIALRAITGLEHAKIYAYRGSRTEVNLDEVSKYLPEL